MLAQPWAQGGISLRRTCCRAERALHWGSEATSRWESVARSYVGPNEELPGFNYAPGPGSVSAD